MRPSDSAAAGLEPVEVGKIPATYFGAKRRHCSRRLAGPNQARDLVAGGDELGDDVRTDMAGPAGD
jgi:hypothetical protein